MKEKALNERLKAPTWSFTLSKSLITLHLRVLPWKAADLSMLSCAGTTFYLSLQLLFNLCGEWFKARAFSISSRSEAYLKHKLNHSTQTKTKISLSKWALMCFFSIFAACCNLFLQEHLNFVMERILFILKLLSLAHILYVSVCVCAFIFMLLSLLQFASLENLPNKRKVASLSPLLLLLSMLLQRSLVV